MNKILVLTIIGLMMLVPFLSAASYSGPGLLTFKGNVGDTVCVPWSFTTSYNQVQVSDIWVPEGKRVTYFNMTMSQEERGVKISYPENIVLNDERIKTQVCMTAPKGNYFGGLIIKNAGVSEGNQVVQFGVWVRGYFK